MPPADSVFTIPAAAPFLDTLAAAILNGDLPRPGGGPLDPAGLAAATILLPTRRACRAMREALHRQAGTPALLLPSIRPLGDVDEDAALLASEAALAADPELALELPPAIAGLERTLLLSELVLAWMRRAGAASEGVTDIDGGGLYDMALSARPHHAAQLAAELARLMDAVDNEQADLSGVAGLVPGQFASHWQRTLEFLEIVTQNWPAVLEERGALAPYVRRNRLMEAETRRLAANPPPGPVIAAGSTGTVPATARLLATVAGLERGAVVLPGLDMQLDEESWRSLTEGEGHPDHPQYGLKLLLDRLGIARAAVGVLGHDGRVRARAKLVSEIMRPSGSTARWRDLGGDAARDIAEGARGIHRIDTTSEQEEAEAVALILRRAAEEPDRSAALVTPDRILARRVSARLAKWDLYVDDSAGRPVTSTPPGVFLDLIVEAVAAQTPLAALALLKHPLARLGEEPALVRAAARGIEIAVWRGTPMPPAISGLADAVARAREEDDGYRPRAVRQLSKRDWRLMTVVAQRFEAAFAPLLAMTGEANPAAFAQAHVAVAEALAAGPNGQPRALWSSEAGEALALFFADFLQLRDRGPAIGLADYPELFRTLLRGLAIRPRREAHPRLFIWGQLEARLQQPDTVILAGLNEGTWPATADADHWLSRPMRAAVGLAAPERRVGLAAHDFAQLMGAGEVYLVRSDRLDGAPTVPSRWLQRLDAVLHVAQVRDALRLGPWSGWLRSRDNVEPAPRAARPEPRPPLAARPRRLSVTRIEKWIANPYDIYAADILKLRPLDPLAGAPDARLKGSVIHDALNRFAEKFPGTLPPDIAGELLAEADALFEAFGADAGVRAFWRPQFERFARWFAATEAGRRADVARVHSELRGEMAVGNDFTLSARADRIDARDDGSLVIYDYKTGAPPSKKSLETLRAPQLPLEAAIAAAGGFPGLGRAQVARLCHIRVLGRGADGEETDVPGAPSALAGQALDELHRLLEAYGEETTPYRALRRPGFDYRFDDYAHLARLDEWLDDTAGED
ncbi:MAG: double-strand break repair protein AddB [Hyphomicrobiales bacterium]